MKKKLLLAMSGGLDSSVSLLLLKDKYDVIGVTLKLYESKEYDSCNQRTCCAQKDVEDAKSVAAKYDVNHYTFNFKDCFKVNVIDRFTESYIKGRTPNPCIDCNRYVKFSELMRRADELGCEYLATGHYARIEKDETTGRYNLLKAVDLSKDQSYVLYNLTQEQLARIIFPMGDKIKKDARKLAESCDFINAEKPDSQDICFVPDGDYAKFIETSTGFKSKTGNFVDTKGNILGRHKGLLHYTIGQRKGLGISFGKPMYVVDINTQDNTVVLGDGDELLKPELIATDINLISIAKITEPIHCKAKTRYKQPEQPCTLYPLESGEIKVVFDNPQRAITPGQAVVFYDGDKVIGGGRIK